MSAITLAQVLRATFVYSIGLSTYYRVEVAAIPLLIDLRVEVGTLHTFMALTVAL